MNLIELDRALRQLRLSGMAAVLETRLRHAQTEKLAPIDLVSTLVSDELLRRQDRLLERRHKQARFRDPDRSLDTFDFEFNKKMNRALIHDLATGRFIAQREDALFLGPPGTGKSHLAQAIGRAVIQQGYRVSYYEAHTLLEEITDATLDGTRKAYLADLVAVPLLIIDDLGIGSCRTPRLKICWKSSCGATSARPRSWGQTDRWTIGGSSSATPPPSPRCSIACSITPTCSSAGRAAGAPKSRLTCAPRRPCGECRGHTSRGIRQVDPTSDRRSWGILGRRRSPEEPVDRARAVENANGAFPTSSLDGAQNVPPTTAHKAITL